MTCGLKTRMSKGVPGGRAPCPRIAFLGMKSSKPDLQRVLVLLGFLLVAGANYLRLGSLLSPPGYAFFWIVSAVGYVLLGWASWAWLTALSRTREGRTGMRWVLRLVALACLVLGVAYAGLINEIIDLHRQLHHVGLRRQLQLRAIALRLLHSLIGILDHSQCCGGRRTDLGG